MASVGEPTYLTDLTNRSGTISVRCTQSTPQTGWTTGTYNTLNFQADDYDWGDLHDTTTNTSRINIGVKLGLWLVGGLFCAVQASTHTGYRVHLTMNGTAVNGALTCYPSNSNGALATLPLPMTTVLATASTDYIELQGLVAGTGTLGSSVNSEARSAFNAVFIGVQ